MTLDVFSFSIIKDKLLLENRIHSVLSMYQALDLVQKREAHTVPSDAKAPGPLDPPRVRSFQRAFPSQAFQPRAITELREASPSLSRVTVF